MAISIAQTPFAFTKPQLGSFRSENQLPVPVFGQNSRHPCFTQTRTLGRFLAPAVASQSSTVDVTEKVNEGDPPPTYERRVADSWRKYHGEDNWAGLLEPLDPILRIELLVYGEMAQFTYDAFDYDPYSKYCGSCRFPPSQFFKGLSSIDIGYKVERYLYATSNISLPNFFKKSFSADVWNRNANYMGYIAVSNDELSKKLGRRDIVVVWRGTITELEWVADLTDFQKPISENGIPCPDPSVKVEAGFVNLYTDKEDGDPFCKLSAREQMINQLKEIIPRYPNEELSITVTGHSLGGALTVLSAYDIVESGLHVMGDGRRIPVCGFTFAGPRVGNLKFKERLEDTLGVKILRVVNVHDKVPQCPGAILNENTPAFLFNMLQSIPWAYTHVGVKIELDHKDSPYLKPSINLGDFHNLETHLHLLDGYQGKGNFKTTFNRDIALVNKSCGFLKDELLVPPSWKQPENKGLILTEDGRWVQPERPPLPHHIEP
ncbi:hypothetical protein LguiB_026919 [Lonicera macranthoides]